MPIAAVKAHINWKVGRHLIRNYPDAAARKFIRAIEAKPSDDNRARRAVEMLFFAGRLDAARFISQSRMSSEVDRLHYWRHYDSFLNELKLGVAAENSRPEGTVRVALFNDTDYRVNIGCRLTSQGLKYAIRQAIPDAEISSRGFNFQTFRRDFGGCDASMTIADFRNGGKLRERIEAAYGASANAAIERADLVVVQPEGSLDDDTPLDGILTFFAPAILAHLLGRPSAILNGTIPIYHDSRGSFLWQLFAEFPAVAARDQMSAEFYDIKFLPDAALLHDFAASSVEKDGCLITTGARNSPEEDLHILRRALEVCDATNLRPVILTRASGRFRNLESDILSRGGVLAETAGILHAANTISGCRLHVGGRYHMAIFSHVAGVPSLLYDVKTHKNQWLSEYSPLVTLVRHKRSVVEEAITALQLPKHAMCATADIEEAYRDFLRQATTAAVSAAQSSIALVT